MGEGLVFTYMGYCINMIQAGATACKQNFMAFENANCAKSIVTGTGVESLLKRYVVPEVGLPWSEWINA